MRCLEKIFFILRISGMFLECFWNEDNEFDFMRPSVLRRGTLYKSPLDSPQRAQHREVRSPVQGAAEVHTEDFVSKCF